MKRPRKIYSDGNELYILNKSGKKIYIKTSLNKKRVQKAFVKDYKKKKTKVIKPKRKITTYRNRPVLAREIGNAVVKILKEIKKVDTPSASDTQSQSGPAVAESKKPPLADGVGKDTLYMTTDERDNLLLKNIEKRRLDNLLTSGIDLNPVLQAIGYEAQSKNNRLENLEKLATNYMKSETKLTTVPVSKTPVKDEEEQLKKAIKKMNVRSANLGRPLLKPLKKDYNLDLWESLTASKRQSLNRTWRRELDKENKKTDKLDQDSLFSVPMTTRYLEPLNEEDTIKNQRYMDRIMGLIRTPQSKEIPLTGVSLKPNVELTTIPKGTSLTTVPVSETKLIEIPLGAYENEKWYKDYKNQNKSDSEIADEVRLELATKEKKTNKTIRSKRTFLEDYQNNLIGDGHTPLSGTSLKLGNLLENLLYPDESLYESEIKTIMKNKNAVYCPVIARDEIDDIKVNTTTPTFFVMNLSNRDEAGTHWVAVYIDEYDVNYFDSFGKPPPVALKQKLLEINNLTSDGERNLKKFKYNKREIQDPLSSDCGYMSIEFLENMLKGESFAKATNFDEKEVRREIDKYEEEFV
jgi:hypothetical protein